MTCKFHCGDCEPMEKTETIPCYLCDKNVNKVNNLINWLWCQFGNKTRDFYWRLNGKTVLIGKAVRTKKRPSWIECQGLWKSTVQIAFRCAHWDKNAFLVKKMPICSKKEKNAEIRFFWGWKFKFVFKGEKGISHQCAAMFLQLYVEEREKYCIQISNLGVETLASIFRRRIHLWQRWMSDPQRRIDIQFWIQPIELLCMWLWHLYGLC